MGVVMERRERAGVQWAASQRAEDAPASAAAVTGGLRHLQACFTEGDEVAAELAARFLLHAGLPLLEVCEALLAEVAGVTAAGGTLLEASDAEVRARRVLSRLGGAPGRGAPEVLVFTDRVDALGTALHRVLEQAGHRVSTALVSDPSHLLAIASERDWATVVLDHGDVRGPLGPVGGVLAALVERRPRPHLVVVGDRWDGVGADVDRAATWTCRDLRRLVTACGALPRDPLTERERDVLAAVAAGRSNEQIGRHLQLSLSTVKTYLERVHAKLGSVDRASAVAIAVRRGWV